MAINTGIRSRPPFANKMIHTILPHCIHGDDDMKLVSCCKHGWRFGRPTNRRTCNGSAAQDFGSARPSLYLRLSAIISIGSAVGEPDSEDAAGRVRSDNTFEPRMAGFRTVTRMARKAGGAEI